MPKLKIIIIFMIFIILILTVGCRQRIIESPENPDNHLPLEELALNSEEPPTEPIIEPEVVTEPPTDYEEPTTEPVTEPITDALTTVEPTIETTVPTTAEPTTVAPTAEPTTAQNIIIQNLNVETVTESIIPIQVPADNNAVQNNNIDEDDGNQEETREEETEPPPEVSDNSEDIITLEEIPERSGEMALSDEGSGTVGIIVDQYAEFLNTSLITLYECQQYYIYYEHVNDYQTINRNSPEHKLIIETSAYNVGEKLMDDALTVSGDWVLRKNPNLIIKCVGDDILGGSVNDTDRAKSLSEDILSRPEWEGMSAVINRNIILISEELLSSDDGRLLAKLYIASAMYPELFTGIEVSDFRLQLKEAGGKDFTDGVYFYLNR